LVYIVIAIIVIWIICVIIGKIKDGIVALSGAVGPITLIITAILCVIAYFAFSWIGVLIVAAIGLGVSFILRKSGQALAEHDKRKKEAAVIKKETKQMDIRHRNQLALQEELSKNCKWLGEMNAEKWKMKLPNYVNLEYDTSFEMITGNFAKQIEEENILQNDDWFNAYLDYIVKNGKGFSVIQLLNRVACPQMQMTHITPTATMLKAKLDQSTKRISDDVPALLQLNAGETYWPTRYAQNRYGILDSDSSKTTVYELDSL